MILRLGSEDSYYDNKSKKLFEGDYEELDAIYSFNVCFASIKIDNELFFQLNIKYIIN